MYMHTLLPLIHGWEVRRPRVRWGRLGAPFHSSTPARGGSEAPAHLKLETQHYIMGDQPYEEVYEYIAIIHIHGLPARQPG